MYVRRHRRTLGSLLRDMIHPLTFTNSDYMSQTRVDIYSARNETMKWRAYSDFDAESATRDESQGLLSPGCSLAPTGRYQAAGKTPCRLGVLHIPRLRGTAFVTPVTLYMFES